MSKQVYNGFERMKRMFCPIRRIIPKFMFLIKKKEGAPPRLSKKEGRGTSKGHPTLTFLPGKCQSGEFWQKLFSAKYPICNTSIAIKLLLIT